MLDQYRINKESLEKQPPLKKRKLVFVLAGAALALLCFLFLLGSLRSESTPTAQNTPAKDLIAAFKQLERAQEALSLRLATIEASLERKKEEVAVLPQEQALITAPAVQEPTVSPPKTYRVASGDTLSEISMRVYGTPNRWQKIYDANKSKIDNINNLKVGTELIIPS